MADSGLDHDHGDHISWAAYFVEGSSVVRNIRAAPRSVRSFRGSNMLQGATRADHGDARRRALSLDYGAHGSQGPSPPKNTRSITSARSTESVDPEQS